MERVRILDIPVDVVNMRSAMEHVEQLIQKDSRNNYILAINPEKVIALQKDSRLKRLFENAEMLVPDGIGVVIAARLLHHKVLSRVPGADLMQNLCSIAPQKKYRIFIFGSKENTNKLAVEKLREAYPGMQIVGRAHGYQSKEDMPDLVEKINKSGANLLFVALGSPKQEEWITEHISLLNVNVCQGIGGTLDTIAGTTKRAPVIFQKTGFEWLYRLMREPSRIVRQSILPLFAFKVLKEALRSR